MIPEKGRWKYGLPVGSLRKARVTVECHTLNGDMYVVLKVYVLSVAGNVALNKNTQNYKWNIVLLYIDMVFTDAVGMFLWFLSLVSFWNHS